jgi:hypothetical protein
VRWADLSGADTVDDGEIISRARTGEGVEAAVSVQQIGTERCQGRALGAVKGRAQARAASGFIP